MSEHTLFNNLLFNTTASVLSFLDNNIKQADINFRATQPLDQYCLFFCSIDKNINLDNNDNSGVWLLLSPIIGMQVSAQMFDLKIEELSEQQITDANSELCNMLAGAIINKFVHDADVGIPQKLDMQEKAQQTKFSQISFTVETTIKIDNHYLFIGIS